MSQRGAPASDLIRFSAAAACAAALLLPIAGSAEEPPDLKAIEQTLAAEKAKSAELKAREAALAAELEGLQGKLVAAAAGAQQAEQQLADMSVTLARLEEEEHAKAAALAHRRAQTALTLAALERLALRPPDALLAAPGTPLDTVRGALLLKTAVPALSARSAALKAELVELTRLRAQIAESRAALLRASEERIQAADAIASLIDAKAALLAKTEGERRKTAEKAKMLAEEASDVRELLAKLSAEEERRKAEADAKRAAAAAEEAKAEADRMAALAAAAARDRPAKPAQPASEPDLSAPAPQTAEEGDFLTLPQPPPASPQPTTVAALGPKAIPLVEQPNLVRPFPSDPASLLMPARGRVARLFDASAAASPLSKGIVIETLPRAQVIAPFDGHVVFQGPFRGYGAILIIEHSGGYHTLLSGLGRIDVAVGQWLIAGEPVGVMSSSGRPELYVELRRASQPIDPLPWLQISGDKVKG